MFKKIKQLFCRHLYTGSPKEIRCVYGTNTFYRDIDGFYHIRNTISEKEIGKGYTLEEAIDEAIRSCK